MSSPSETAAVEGSLAYLASPAAYESLKRDAYWPKWDSPWWHMTLLWELGLAARIPRGIVDALLEAMRSQYLNFFPLSEAELPPGKSEYKNVLCHCALGTIEQVLRACGVDLRRELPWTDGWYKKYQLPDGGVNCEKAAYSGSKKGSIVSTVPCLEAVLSRGPKLSQDDLAFLQGAANYLAQHRLVRRLSGELISEEWLKPCFPRFYEYDVLRGARFLLALGKSGVEVPEEALEDARPWFGGKPAAVGRDALAKTTFVWTGAWWDKQAASRFPLLQHVSRPGAQLPAAALLPRP